MEDFSVIIILVLCKSNKTNYHRICVKIQWFVFGLNPRKLRQCHARGTVTMPYLSFLKIFKRMASQHRVTTALRLATKVKEL